MPTTPEKRYAYYWKNAEKIRERNRAYNYTKRGLEVPEKKIYKLRSMKEHVEVLKEIKASTAVATPVPTSEPAPPKRTKKPVPVPVPTAQPAPAPTPAISFTLTADDFK